MTPKYNLQLPTAGSRDEFNLIENYSMTTINTGARDEPPEADKRRPVVRARSATEKSDYRIAWIVTVTPCVLTVAAIVLIFFGLRPGILELSLCFGMYLLTLIGVEVGFHRHFTHSSFKTYMPIRATLAILGSMGFEGPVIWWTAVHRRHHKYSDEEGDPHSPNLHGPGPWGSLKGFYHAHMGWLFDSASTRGAGWNTYTPDLYRDKTIFRIHAWYFYWLGLGVVVPVLICALAHHNFSGALLGLLWGGAVRIFLLNHAIWAINSVTHRWGKRDFHTPDHSTNNIWLSLPTLGEAWHNNHHAFPSSAFTGFCWWQLDPGGWIIELMKRTGLAWDVKRPTREHIKRKLIEPA